MSNDNVIASRFCGAIKSSASSVSPIQGYEEAPLVSLEKAIEPLIPIVPRVKDMVHMVQTNYKQSPNDLSMDEAWAIMLYTQGWSTEEKSFYFIMNSILRAEDPKQMFPWFLYLKLCIHALSKLPSEHQFLYRGVKKDLAQDFSKGETFFWWQFNSCTTSIDVLQEELFLGKTGKRTIFTIESFTGKSIQSHSAMAKEKEVLLLPGCRFQIDAILDAGNDLNIVQIREIEPHHSLAVFLNDNMKSSPVKKSPSILAKKTYNSDSYSNASLEETIRKCQSKKLNLFGENLNDQDIWIINKQGIIGKQLKSLDLTFTRITAQGVSILSSAIADNLFLEQLNISNNSISDLGVQYLVSVVNSSILKRIDLSENDISDEGARYIAEMLKTNMKLTGLSLSQNQISNEGVKILADVLNSENTVLETLNLSANSDIDDESVNILIDMIRQNSSLKELDLRYCDLSKDGDRELKKASKSKKEIRLLLSSVI